MDHRFLRDLRRASPFLVRETDRKPAMERSGPGRPPKWDDSVEIKTLKARVPAELLEAFQNEAARRGMSTQDFLGRLAEEITGVPYAPQGGLPLSA